MARPLDTEATYAEVLQNLSHSIIGISREEYLDSLDSFHNFELGENVLINDTILKWFEN